jgi:transposase
MKIKYVGADAHSTTTSFTVREASGAIVSRTTVRSTPKELVSVVKAIPGVVHLTLEEGTLSAWLYELFRPLVAKVVVCNPRHNKLMQGNKSDRLDADRLSELLRVNSLVPVYHGENGTRVLKDLVYAYDGLVSDSVRSKNKVKAIFRSRGIPTGEGGAVYLKEQREEWLAKIPMAGLRQRAAWLLSELDAQMTLREEAGKAVAKESRRHAACKTIATIPGIGPVRAAYIVAILDTPHRFRSKRQLWTYAGLAVVTRTSNDYTPEKGEWRKKKPATRGLNRNRNPLLKAVFKGAALDASRAGFKDYYEKLTSRLDPSIAQVTLARKIAAITLAAWKKGEKYKPGLAFHPPV